MFVVDLQYFGIHGVESEVEKGVALRYREISKEEGTARLRAHPQRRLNWYIDARRCRDVCACLCVCVCSGDVGDGRGPQGSPVMGNLRCESVSSTTLDSTLDAFLDFQIFLREG